MVDRNAVSFPPTTNITMLEDKTILIFNLYIQDLNIATPTTETAKQTGGPEPMIVGEIKNQNGERSR